MLFVQVQTSQFFSGKIPLSVPTWGKAPAATAVLDYRSENRFSFGQIPPQIDFGISGSCELE